MSTRHVVCTGRVHWKPLSAALLPLPDLQQQPRAPTHRYDTQQSRHTCQLPASDLDVEDARLLIHGSRVRGIHVEHADLVLGKLPHTCMSHTRPGRTSPPPGKSVCGSVQARQISVLPCARPASQCAAVCKAAKSVEPQAAAARSEERVLVGPMQRARPGVHSPIL